MHRRHPFHHIDDYAPFVGADTIDRVRAKADLLRGVHVAHVNSTFYGGGVAELLSSLTLLMTSVGIKTGWRAIHGPPDFFSITKKMHNALQGAEIHLTELKTDIYEDGVNGFLVDSVPQAAERIVELVANETLREQLASQARGTVLERFLLIRLLEQYLDLFNSFRTDYQLTRPPDAF